MHLFPFPCTQSMLDKHLLLMSVLHFVVWFVNCILSFAKEMCKNINYLQNCEKTIKKIWTLTIVLIYVCGLHAWLDGTCWNCLLISHAVIRVPFNIRLFVWFENTWLPVNTRVSSHSCWILVHYVSSYWFLKAIVDLSVAYIAELKPEVLSQDRSQHWRVAWGSV